MRTVMGFVFLGLVLLKLAWPVFALAAVILAVRVAFALQDGRGARSRALRLSIAASASTAFAAYGYGLGTTTFGLVTDADDRCGIVRPDRYGYGYHGPADGTHRMWPLQDTTCGPDLVPWFVNPLVAGSVVLLVVLVVVMVVARVGSRRH
ncbi:hypothetical protein [Micromonospora sagamiensis]|uniref:Uncharacterized protein n=1 Tax=Micromonospora sagamiensis TaxID=47875 RepID=A0A562WNV5_9ACTN|nr:hypothetical protein [Micromonospora sagamiensis]TWJ31507.1 hypothetical protein JD81_05064 [Micromonospora sagamiensis]BCL15444.1 hypothetical protein GCM10017556_31830 [Micromonospora sagamiensis]